MFFLVLKLMAIPACTIQSWVRRTKVALPEKPVRPEKIFKLCVALSARVLNLQDANFLNHFWFTFVVLGDQNTQCPRRYSEFVKGRHLQKNPNKPKPLAVNVSYLLINLLVWIFHVEICFLLSILFTSLPIFQNRWVIITEPAERHLSWTAELIFTEMFFGQAVACREFSSMQTAELLGRQTFSMLPPQKGRESWLSDSILLLHSSHPTLTQIQRFFLVTGPDDPIVNLYFTGSPQWWCSVYLAKMEGTDHGTCQYSQECAARRVSSS